MPTNKVNYLKKYYQENKDKYKAYEQQTYKCEVCNKAVRKYRRTKHEVTKKHLDNKSKVENLSEEDKKEMGGCLNKTVKSLEKRLKSLLAQVQKLE
jgi:IMP dehydrogenase/GMP reductase